MPLSLFAAFWAVSVLFVITPGADWAYAISAGIRGKGVMPAVAGMLVGHLIAILIVAAGVGTVITAQPQLMHMLTLAGALYLIWLGIGVIRKPSVPDASDESAITGRAGWAVKGLCVSGLNPKVFLLFLALLPQFTDTHASWPLPAQMIAMGMVHLISCGAVYLLVGYGARIVLKSRPRMAKGVSRMSGILMVIIALMLISEQFYRTVS